MIHRQRTRVTCRQLSRLKNIIMRRPLGLPAGKGKKFKTTNAGGKLKNEHNVAKAAGSGLGEGADGKIQVS